MTDQQAAEKIRTLEGDTETNHAEADQILCSVLRQLGYHETAEAFEDLPKWYA